MIWHRCTCNWRLNNAGKGSHRQFPAVQPHPQVRACPLLPILPWSSWQPIKFRDRAVDHPLLAVQPCSSVSLCPRGLQCICTGKLTTQMGIKRSLHVQRHIACQATQPCLALVSCEYHSACRVCACVQCRV